MDSRRKTEFIKGQFLVFLLLFFSGNPLASIFGSIKMIAFLIIALAVMGKIKDFKLFLDFYKRILFGTLIIFLLQYIILGFVSPLGIINFFFKIFVGGLIVFYLKDKFNYLLIVVLYKLCLLSLIGFVIINILKIPIPGIQLAELQTSFVVYGVRGSKLLQNIGMFWEPGAFSGIITIILALNLNNLKTIWEHKRKYLYIIGLALLTTQSTTGFLVGFIIIGSYFLIQRGHIAIFILPVLLFAAFYIYSNTTFLNEKIEHQFNSAMNLDEGEFSNTRFGSLIFDWHYILKHPIIGNGLHEKTRYADHPILVQQLAAGQDIGNGNGFSNYLASMGIPFMIIYFILIFNAMRKESVKYAIVVVTVILFNFQGEQWMNFPFYLSIPFVILSYRRQLSTNKIFQNRYLKLNLSKLNI